jgi:hypothetical protein
VITPPAGWVQHVGAHLVTLYPPDAGARIRFYERLRIAPRFSNVLEKVLSFDPHFRSNSLHDIQTLLTAEGEFGAWVRVLGTRDGRQTVRFVGAVFGDEHVAALDAFVMIPDRIPLIERTTRELLHTMTFRLGTRRRRYYYHPPPQWRAIASGLVANWYPAEFPMDYANLVVAPAEPSNLSLGDALEIATLIESDHLAGFELDGPVDESELVANGMQGRRIAFTTRRAGETRYRELAGFAQPPYIYMLRMESRTPERFAKHHEIFTAVASSIMPLPKPGQAQVVTNNDVFAYWGD